MTGLSSAVTELEMEDRRVSWGKKENRRIVGVVFMVGLGDCDWLSREDRGTPTAEDEQKYLYLIVTKLGR